MNVKKTCIGFAVLLIVSAACTGQPRMLKQQMVLVSAGQFTMGVEGGEDNPPHLARISSFWMGKYEVTVKDWRQFIEDVDIPFKWNSFEFLSLARRNVGFVVPDDWPMYYVDWYESVWYCNWLSEREGLKPVYVFDFQQFKRYLLENTGPAPAVRWNRKANGYRLPTEAEWEYAANRGMTEATKVAKVPSIAWIRENADGHPHAVGTKAANSLGLYDMFGNVGEWCWDYFDSSYYQVSPADDPAGPDRGRDPKYFSEDVTEIRSIRGCSWKSSADSCTMQFRTRNRAGFRGTVGLRLARNADSP